MKDTIDESALIEGILSGEKELFRELVERHQDCIFRIIVRQVGDPHTAEELAQDVFIKAFKNLKSFRFRSSFSTWLIRIALNHTYSYLTSKKHRNLLLNDELVPGQHDLQTNPFTDSLETKELLKSFYLCFAKLNKKFQSVITLCGFEERSYEECAEIIEIPLGTVRSRLHKARELVSDCMNQNDRQ